MCIIRPSARPRCRQNLSGPVVGTGGCILGIVYGLAVVFLAHRMGAATLIATVVIIRGNSSVPSSSTILLGWAFKFTMQVHCGSEGAL
jgi:hypothetical protein